ncbi:hypothetical protein [Haloprofundus sp. MHR1]|uniref:hypothetical protein n=1 Tax=Haloprofundus sp. MHR1 TaxID=2572921 RepID=UPI0010BF2A11|nr:hypothetical protein [Haloprofundus sp. MHR1]QCJ46178.1 hypothetical protein FCF25_03175 [Haloprofundus sp. MHR1]
MNTDTSATARTDGGTTNSKTNPSDDRDRSGRDVRTLINYAALAVLVLFALVTAVQLYTAVGGVIDRWVAPDYRIFFRAAFNLVVLLLCVGGISLQLRRLD